MTAKALRPRVAEIVDGEDVGMRQRRDGVGLALEAPPGVPIFANRGGQHLDGDVAPQPRSRARQTSPIPPAPIRATTSYGPSREAGSEPHQRG